MVTGFRANNPSKPETGKVLGQSNIRTFFTASQLNTEIESTSPSYDCENTIFSS